MKYKNILFCFRCHEAGGVIVLVAIREHVHILWDLLSTNINADVSIMKVHKAKELIGKLYIDYYLEHILRSIFSIMYSICILVCWLLSRAYSSFIVLDIVYSFLMFKKIIIKITRSRLSRLPRLPYIILSMSWRYRNIYFPKYLSIIWKFDI